MAGVHNDDHENGEDDIDGGIKPLTANDPARIGPYLLLGRVGAGGMGRVYLARSESGRTVAVKVVHAEHVADPQFRARFRREVDAARRVGERYTAPVLDAAPDEEYPWVATGYVPGLSLEQVVRGHGALPTESVLALADGLLRALKDIHAAGIVHRDLKPSNVMLTVEGPKVIDFGIARAVETSVDSLLTSTGMVIGSPGFMAPEQIRGESAGPKSDVFTLGCVLTYAATGTLPFGHGVSNQHAVMYHIVEADPDLARVRDEGLRTLISRLLTKSPDERPSVEQLLAESDRVHLAPASASWLPADVVGHLARQSAQLLDAEAAPVRQERVECSTIGLRPAGPVPEAVLIGGTAEPKRKREKRRRRLIVSVPVVLVLAGGGGTMAVLQPFSGDSGNHASAPSAGATSPATPTSPEGTPSQGEKSPGASGGKDKEEDRKGDDGKDGRDGKDGQNAENPGTGSGSSGGGGTSPTGGSSTSSSSGGGSPSGGGGSSSTSGSTDGSGGGGSSSTSGSTDGSGGSGGGGSVPSSFVGTWKFGEAYNTGQPGTITISRSGVVRMSDFPYNNCPYEAKVTSTANGKSRINVSTSKLVGPNPGYCYTTVDPSFYVINGSGIRHNVGPASGDGYYYKRA
ncbi:serine/threonine-protein kinase [Streptomyces sp. JV185]|uniref:serine/threonine-protein kinase n=1 Tax=Streptomyces sp. JV185 TaxID=858638 RepID=UPI002E7851ED|nr:serine/threonine-protein kinase [Streptomyces sp. JV185]MEE1767887.1 serine/threonine-protein kinase [Streptomyces sp. JV185]